MDFAEYIDEMFNILKIVAATVYQNGHKNVLSK